MKKYEIPSAEEIALTSENILEASDDTGFDLPEDEF